MKDKDETETPPRPDEPDEPDEDEEEDDEEEVEPERQDASVTLGNVSTGVKVHKPGGGSVS